MKIAGVIALVIVNLMVGFFASIIAVGSDGSAHGIYFVGSIFGALNIASVVWAIVLITKQRSSDALKVTALTTPVAVGVTFVLGMTIALMREATR